MKVARPAYREPENPIAACYLRESDRKPGARLDTSLDRQRRLTKEAAARDDCLDGPVFSDHGISGRSMQKLDGLEECLAAAQARRFHRLYIEEFDRIGRNSIEMAAYRERFEQANVRIFDANNTEIDGFLGPMLSIPAERESRVEGERMSSAIRAKTGSGRAYGRELFGYDIDEDDRYRVNATQAETIRLAYAMFRDDPRLMPICSHLNAAGHPAPGEGGWRPDKLLRRRAEGDSMVHSGVLARTEYVGRRTVGRHRHTWSDDGLRIKLPHPEGALTTDIPALINDEIDASVKRRIDEFFQQPKAERAFEKSDYLLQGVLCKECGRELTIGNGQTMACRPWGRTAIMVCAGWDSGSCTNDRQIEIGALQLGVLKATAIYMKRFPCVESYQEAWQETVQAAARRVHGAAASDIAEELSKCDERLARLAGEHAREPSPAREAEIDAAARGRVVLRAALIEADRRESRQPRMPDRDAVGNALDSFMRGMPRHINDIEDPVEREAYRALREVFTTVSAICVDFGRFEFDVSTVLGRFSASAYVRFIALSPLHAGFLATHADAGAMGLGDDDQRREMVRLGSQRNKVTRVRDRLVELEYLEKRGSRWFATGDGPIVIDGKSALVVVKFTTPKGGEA